jgi:putative tryptophan/tyrosine transport system substrate-binding protein
MLDLRRRQFITLLGGGAAAVWPLPARAQPAAKLPIIGFLVPGTPSTHGQWFAALVQRLRELGWTDGRTVAIEYRWAEGRTDRAAETAAEFVRLGVSVIITPGTDVAIAAKLVTSVIPIVFLVSDAVGNGIVASLNRPGGNMTGLSVQQTELSGKRVEILRDLIPGLRRLAIMANVGNPASTVEMDDVWNLTRTLGLEAIRAEIRQAEDIESAFETLKGIDALYVVSHPVVNTARIRINTLALSAGIPTMHSFREYVEVGGLMSYGPNITNLFRRAADLSDKILRGVKPAEIPVEQPTKYDLVINLTTAKALRLKIPEAFLLRADEVIE